MAANSQARRLVKVVARRALGDRGYGWMQAVAMARDIRSGAWHEPELDLVAQAVRPGEVVVDLGANYGLWTWHLSRAVGTSGRVHAYEPVPFTVRTLRRVVRLLRLGNVDIHAVAVGAAASTMTLRVPLQTSGAISAGQAHLADRVDDRPGKEQHVRWPEHTEVECSVVCLDEQLDDRAVTFMKLDIEGAEALALRGAARLLERDHPTLVVEINPWFLDGFGLSVADLLDPLRAIGYEVFRLTDGGRLESVEDADVVEDNYVIVHPTRADRLAGALGR